MFCHAHAHNVITLKRPRLTLAEVPSQCLQVERSNTKSDAIYKTGMSDDFELGGEDEMEPMSSMTFSMLLRKVFFFIIIFILFFLLSLVHFNVLWVLLKQIGRDQDHSGPVFPLLLFQFRFLD